MKTLLIAPFVLFVILVLWIASTFMYQAFWDYRVEGMCDKDGGRVIYEKVELPEREFDLLLDRKGYISLPEMGKETTVDSYARAYDDEVLTTGFLGLSISRYAMKIIRLADNRLIAQQVRYSRTGGDFPFSASHSTAFICPKFPDNIWYERIFLKAD